MNYKQKFQEKKLGRAFDVQPDEEEHFQHKKLRKELLAEE